VCVCVSFHPKMRITLLAVFLETARGFLRLPSIFSDGCVLQTNHEYGARSYVYGRALPGELVTVRTRFPGATTNYTATADGSGKFIVTLNPLAVNGEFFDIFVSGSRSPNFVTAKGCQAGDVYLCGGQSNMCFSAESSFPPGPALAAQSYPFLKLFSVVMEGNSTPQDDFPPQTPSTQCTWNHDKANTSYPCNAWLPSTPAYNGKFSAVCLFTALALAQNHSGTRPLGLIYTAFGGTSVSLWAPPAAYVGCPGREPAGGGELYNAMVNPLVHYSIRSVLWFQGEQDASEEQALPGWYSCRFNRLVAYWRSEWQIGDFPFNYVQLGAVGNGTHAIQQGLLRVAQNSALPHPNGTTDTTAMAVTYDLGDASSPFGDVHFRDKVTVGNRLAAAVLHSAFAQQFPVVNWSPPRVVGVAPASAPPFTALTVALSTDDKLGVALKDGGQCTLCCAGGGAAALVQLQSSKGAWVGAVGVVVAAGGGGLAVTAPSADAYTALRFAVSDYPQCAVVGVGNGYPLPAFEAPVAAAPPAPPARFQLAWRGHVHEWEAGDAFPPMGLNTWNAYHTNVDEVLVKGVGAAFVSLGLARVGWRFVNIDGASAPARKRAQPAIPRARGDLNVSFARDYFTPPPIDTNPICRWLASSAQRHQLYRRRPRAVPLGDARPRRRHPRYGAAIWALHERN
jgi:sialate O-acetylesterase